MKNAFSQFGEIKKVKIMRYKDGKSRHYGYMCFQTNEQACEAMEKSALIVIHNSLVSKKANTLHEFIKSLLIWRINGSGVILHSKMMIYNQYIIKYISYQSLGLLFLMRKT